VDNYPGLPTLQPLAKALVAVLATQYSLCCRRAPVGSHERGSARECAG
jgi:hypothetical protein